MEPRTKQSVSPTWVHSRKGEARGSIVCAWGRVGDTEKAAFFEGLGERKISREELPDILPQALFQPPSKQALP